MSSIRYESGRLPIDLLWVIFRERFRQVTFDPSSSDLHRLYAISLLESFNTYVYLSPLFKAFSGLVRMSFRGICGILGFYHFARHCSTIFLSQKEYPLPTFQNMFNMIHIHAKRYSVQFKRWNSLSLSKTFILWLPTKDLTIAAGKKFTNRYRYSIILSTTLPKFYTEFLQNKVYLDYIFRHKKSNFVKWKKP